jgi:hypothetical protein
VDPTRIRRALMHAQKLEWSPHARFQKLIIRLLVEEGQHVKPPRFRLRTSARSSRHWLISKFSGRGSRKRVAEELNPSEAPPSIDQTAAPLVAPPSMEELAAAVLIQNRFRVRVRGVSSPQILTTKSEKELERPIKLCHEKHHEDQNEHKAYDLYYSSSNPGAKEVVNQLKLRGNTTFLRDVDFDCTDDPNKAEHAEIFLLYVNGETWRNPASLGMCGGTMAVDGLEAVADIRISQPHEERLRTLSNEVAAALERHMKILVVHEEPAAAASFDSKDRHGLCFNAIYGNTPTREPMSPELRQRLYERMLTPLKAHYFRPLCFMLLAREIERLHRHKGPGRNKRWDKGRLVLDWDAALRMGKVSHGEWAGKNGREAVFSIAAPLSMRGDSSARE